ncbi:MAG: tRNA (guanosine(46)-N7)-methyltransferase TrmB [Anaerolineae bacterium]|nr:MAG: tRNA (guanosine(46)-N7)-methyltransferase TrmB [Anaerolineae bacterium]
MPTELMIPTRMSWPCNWHEIFDRDGPLLLEIGFGNGQFLVNLASRQPEAGVIGVEISSPSIKKALNLIEESGIDNVRIIRAQGHLALWTLFEVGLIQGVYINFPDPWPKAKHHKRRLINHKFLHLLATRMARGAFIDIATDHRDYALWITEELERSSYFSSRLSFPYVHKEPNRKPTKYELKALTGNSKCYFFKWQRNQVSAPNSFLIPKEFPMPHVIMDMEISINTIAENLVPFKRHDGDVTVRIVEIFRSVRSNTILCDTIILELPLEQRIMVGLSRRERGDLIIQLHGTGQPRPTAGVQMAIRFIAEEIRKLDPESSIIRHNLGEWSSID